MTLSLQLRRSPSQRQMGNCPSLIWAGRCEGSESLPALQDASDSEDDDSDNDQALADAMGGVHMHGSHRDPEVSMRSLESVGFAPKDEEVHMQAAWSNDAARANSFAVSSAAG